MAKEKKEKKELSSFSILFIIIFVLGIITILLNGQGFAPTEIDGKMVDHVVGAKLSDIIMSPFHGFQQAVDISIFILVLGGFLNIVTQTGALEAGIQNVVKKQKGREIMIIVVLMSLFSLGGSTYGMAEETIPFYTLLTATLVAAGFDTIVAVGTVLLGSGAGVIGSTVNPFSTGAAMDALKSIDIKPDAGTIMLVGAVIWIATTIYCIFLVTGYAKKVQKDKGSTILSLQEQEDMEKYFGQEGAEELEFTSKHKLILGLFASCFLVMVVSLIPWGEFGINIFEGWTAVITGNSFGDWYFGDLAIWFFIMAIIIAVANRFPEKEIIDTFVAGAADMLSVVLIIVVARGAAVLMQATHLDLFILDRASGLLKTLPAVAFVIGAYILYLLLSFLIPSTSGLAYVSIPIMGALAKEVGLSPDVMVIIFASGCGLINLITPTSGVVMGGLQISRVNYSTWTKFMAKPIIIIGLINLAILIGSMLIFS
ncbi:YfcC family protein [Vagococcus silagei]|uniref:YfcC family protein n=1 Tax=Vagococcus silagei TaxID=2508885 RepID=A0A4S3B2V4_9ENTE|nr:YfcC family protein [Vagococcus silagei]THB60567.1 YfcC family protein [Vagococcus silagei]